MNASETLFDPSQATTQPSISGASVDALDDSELDRAPFGIICLDAEGIILSYNLYESRLARLDRNQVLGRSFFDEVARCTRGEMFEGRFRRFVDGSEAQDDRSFEYVFDFAFGAQRVAVELHRVEGHNRYYLFINRKSVGPAREAATEIAASQSSLAPDEVSFGLRRDDMQRRFVEAPATLLLALRSTFAKLAPEAGPLFSNEWGVQWGRRAAIELEADALEAEARSLEELAMSQAARRIADYLESRGWGRVGFDFAAVTEGVLVVHVERSVIAESAPFATLGRSSRKEGECALFAGFFAGALSHIAGRKLVAREVSCLARGAPRCDFAVLSAERGAALDRALATAPRSIGAVRAALKRPTSHGAKGSS
jgi:photoactive yellow protein